MSGTHNGKFVISKEAPNPCELCGEFLETRPYGPGGKRVCFPCAMKDEAGTKRRFIRAINGKEPK